MIVNENNFFEVLEYLKQKDDLSLDTETTGLLFEDRLFSIIISCFGSNKVQNYYFSFNASPLEGDSVPCLDKNLLACLGTLFADPSKVWYIHNANFDLVMLLKEGVCIMGTVHCTLGTERIIHNILPSYSLAKLCKKYHLGEKLEDKVKKYITKHKLFTKIAVPGKAREQRKPHYDQVPFDMISEYGMQDGELTFILGRKQRQFIRRPENELLVKVAANERKLSHVCAAMSYLGIKLDTDYTQSMFDKESKLLDDLKAQYKDSLAADFSRSSRDLLQVFRKNGLKVPLTSRGNPSFNSEVLSEIDHPLPRLILDIRKREKFLGTYYSSFLYYKDSNDLIHPYMHQAGTETGRFSYSSPNLQNVPKNSVVRKCFIPRNDDYFLVGIDYDQQEYRIMADRAGEHSLIKMVMEEGVDVHTATAKMMGVDRVTAKTINFMLLYGGGAKKLAETLKVSVQKAQSLKNLYFSRLPAIGKFINKVKSTGQTHGYVHNFLHRKFSCTRDTSYKLPNHLIQGSGADVIKVAMVKLYEYLLPKKSNMILQVHDELLFEIHKRELDIIEDIKDIMTNVYPSKNGIKLSVEETYYKSWGEPHGQEARDIV